MNLIQELQQISVADPVNVEDFTIKVTKAKEIGVPTETVDMHEKHLRDLAASEALLCNLCEAKEKDPVALESALRNGMKLGLSTKTKHQAQKVLAECKKAEENLLQAVKFCGKLDDLVAAITQAETYGVAKTTVAHARERAIHTPLRSTTPHQSTPTCGTTFAAARGRMISTWCSLPNRFGVRKRFEGRR